MKAIFWTAALIGIVGVATASAQNIVLAGGLTQPVGQEVEIGYSSESYQTPVVIQGPVIVQQAPQAYGAQPRPYYRYRPNVIYFGGPASTCHGYYGYGNYSPRVIHFGRHQSYRQGYHFNHCR